MSFYEELLTFGSHLRETERVALYKYLLIKKRDSYVADAMELIAKGELKREIANGEILYSINDDVLTYSARKKGTQDFIKNLRTIHVNRSRKNRIRRTIKFFAQSDVDVIWNYPIQGGELQEEGDFTIISIPYCDVRYFAEGKGRIAGLINRWKFDDHEVMRKLKAS